MVDIRVNRRKAVEFMEEGKVDNDGTRTLFGQIMQQLKQEDPEMACFRK